MVCGPKGLAQRVLRGAGDHLAKWPALLAKWSGVATASPRPRPAVRNNSVTQIVPDHDPFLLPIFAILLFHY